MNLIPEWRDLWKKWSVQLAALGILVPELLQLVADNSTALPWFDDSTKNTLRLACLACVILARSLQQKAAP